jgi:hypothetical protein
MESKEPVRQRTTAMRKAPGAAAAPPPAPAPRPAPVAAAKPGASRPPLRSGAPGAGPRKPLGAGVRPAAASGGGSGLKKVLMLFILLALGGIVAGGFVMKDKNGTGLWISFLNRVGLLKGGVDKDAKKDVKVTKAKKRLDLGYEASTATRVRSEAYLKKELAKAEANPAALTFEAAREVADETAKMAGRMKKAVADLVVVCDKITEGEAADIDIAKAKEELETGKKVLLEVEALAGKWKEIKEKKEAESGALAKPDPDKPKEEPKPGEPPVPLKPVDPKSEPERPAVASGKPTPEKPKPKEEPKPEPEKPKPEPEKPKPEPEKPKEEPKPEPKPEPAKPEPEKPKPEPEKPKPEPEKPKPEPEKPKPEPEKPKEEPKPEPKPEPAKPKPETVLAEADKLLIDGSVFYKELGSAMSSLPSDNGKLKALLMKKETTQAFFTKARDSYLSVKETTPDPAKLEKRLGQIEVVLGRLQKYEEEIKSKLK